MLYAPREISGSGYDINLVKSRVNKALTEQLNVQTRAHPQRLQAAPLLLQDGFCTARAVLPLTQTQHHFLIQSEYQCAAAAPVQRVRRQPGATASSASHRRAVAQPFQLFLVSQDLDCYAIQMTAINCLDLPKNPCHGARV